MSVQKFLNGHYYTFNFGTEDLHHIYDLNDSMRIVKNGIWQFLAYGSNPELFSNHGTMVSAEDSNIICGVWNWNLQTQFSTEVDLAGVEIPISVSEVACTHCGTHYSHASIQVRHWTLIHDVDVGFEAGSHSGYYCQDCYNSLFMECCDCGEIFPRNETTIMNGGRYCINCRDNLSPCYSCGSHHSNLREHEDGNNYCYNCYPPEPCCVHEHSWNPYKFKKYETPGQCLLGMELEVEGGADGAEYLNDGDPNEDHYYLKEDGSLGSGGVEIVTMPHSYNELLKLNWKAKLEKLIKLGYRSHDGGRCGLHFHLDRDYLGAEGTANIVYLTDKFQEELFRFSRRTRSTWNRWAKSYQEAHGTTLKYAEALVRYNGDGDRYHAVNLRNRDTVELRFMRGTLKYSTWIASVQLAHTMALVCTQLSSTEIQDLSFYELINYTGLAEIQTYWNSLTGTENQEAE